MQRHISRNAATALLLLPFAASAAPGGEGAVRLQMKFAPGITSRYRTTARITNSLITPGKNTPDLTNTIELDMVQQQKVVRALPKGGGEIEAITLSGSVRLNGSPQGNPADANAVVTRYDAQGNVVAVKGLDQTIAAKQVFGGGILGAGFLNMQRLYLPTKAVKLGQTWSQDVSMPGLPVLGRGKVTSRYLRDEKVGRYQTARIRAALEMPMKVLFDAQSQPTTNPKFAASVLSGTLRMNFDCNFAPAEGRLVRSAGDGGVTLLLQPRNARKVSKTAALPQSMRVPMKMQIGNNLIE